MIVESGKRGCVREVMILAAALTIQDPRERPTDKQQLAAEKHARFRDENSDFTGFLNLWNYLQEKQQELSSTAVPQALPQRVHQLPAGPGVAGPVRPAPPACPAAGHQPGQQAPCRPGGQPRGHPHQPALRAAEPHRHPRRAQARVRRRPRQPLRDLPGLGTVQEVTHVRDGRRARGDEPALGPRGGEVRSALGRAGGPGPGQAQLQRTALVQEDGRGDGPREGHAVRRAHHPEPADQLRQGGSGALPRALHPPCPGRGRLADAPQVLPPQPRAAARSRGTRGPDAAPRHPGGRRDTLRVLRRPDRQGGRLGAALRQVVEGRTAAGSHAARLRPVAC